MGVFCGVAYRNHSDCTGIAFFTPVGSLCVDSRRVDMEAGAR